MRGDLPMMLESFIWLFLVVFVLHELEEILTMENWLKEHGNLINERVPKRLKFIVPLLLNTTTPKITVIVMEEFLLAAVVTLVIVEGALFDLFAAMVMGYLIHLLVHGAQALYLKRYIPGLCFGIVSGLYGVFVLIYFGRLSYLDWGMVWKLTPLLMAVIALNLAGGHILAGKVFDTMKASGENSSF